MSGFNVLNKKPTLNTKWEVTYLCRLDDGAEVPLTFTVSAPNRVVAEVKALWDLNGRGLTIARSKHKTAENKPTKIERVSA